MKELMKLFIAFAKIGAFTFGGGLSMLPMLKHEIVTKRAWATEEEILDIYAVGQCTPGVIAVNTATYIGYKRRGVMGGVISTLGMLTPSIVIILIVAVFLRNFMEVRVVQAALEGIRAAVCALMLNTIITLCKKTIVNVSSFLIYLVAFVVTLFFEISSLWIVIGAGVVGYFSSKKANLK